MNATEALPNDSYAPPARRRGYVQAMRKIAEMRPADTLVRVYISAPPSVIERPNWGRRLEAVRDALPGGVELLYFNTVFPADIDMAKAWPEFAETLDGLVVIGKRKKAGSLGRTLQLGPVARTELLTLVAQGKPVLLHTLEYGLVPVLDCAPNRTGPKGRERLKLKIPDGWSSEAPTLRAALTALAPPRREGDAVQADQSAHLVHPSGPPH
ncbi:hypothetical protein [Wenjunlia tyrosinilytica]|nr:hypothetical protein [Wenjunlia tyrosinilytica]